MLDDYIPIDKEEIPYSFEMEFEGEIYTFEVNYNAEYDFFTIDLYKGDTALVMGEKVVYGQALFGSYTGIFPATIVPLDASGKENSVTYDNLENTVFLYLVEGEI